MTDSSVIGVIEAVKALLVPLRMGQGLDETALADLERALEKFAVDWSHEKVIPKVAASVLAELIPSLESASYLYPDERGQRILELSATLSDKVARCFEIDSA